MEHKDVRKKVVRDLKELYLKEHKVAYLEEHGIDYWFPNKITPPPKGSHQLKSLDDY